MSIIFQQHGIIQNGRNQEIFVNYCSFSHFSNIGFVDYFSFSHFSRIGKGQGPIDSTFA